MTSAIDLKSPGVEANGVIKPSVSCGYGSLWIPLEWGGLPEDTKELAVLLARFEHVKDGNGKKLVVPFADLVSQFAPSEHQLVANVLPEGVRWSYIGRENCVPVREGQTILLEVFALDRVSESRVLNRALATRLTEEALTDPEPKESPRSPGKLTNDTAGIGRLFVSYGPPPPEQSVQASK